MATARAKNISDQPMIELRVPKISGDMREAFPSSIFSIVLTANRSSRCLVKHHCAALPYHASILFNNPVAIR